MSYYLLPLRPYVVQPRASALQYRQCKACGTHQREQVAELRVTVVEPFEAFATTLDGDWIARDDIAEAIRRVESSVAVRPAGVKGASGQWSQLLPTKCIELASSSLRAPRESCRTCGGVARPQLARSSALVICKDSEALPQVAVICGASKLIVFSHAVLVILQSAVPEFTAAGVLFQGESATAHAEEELFVDL